jgi:uncharacterized protein YdeI (YjbR/CyaY-like superfamily)
MPSPACAPSWPPTVRDSVRTVEPLFFGTDAELRAWLEANHASKRELWVGIYKKGSGKTGVTYAEAVDQGICFGWVDSQSRTIDQERYMVRFTPRRERSNWTPGNVARAEEMRAAGLMHEAGIRALERGLAALNRSAS